MARRYDRSPLRKTTRNDAGALVGSAFITRTGVFPYRRQDGSIRYELRPPDEVFKPESLATFHLLPMTLLHPADGHVSSSTARDLQVGSIAAPRQDGIHVAADFAVTVAEAVEAVEGGMQELSCGYDADYDPTPGVWEGQRYDGVQRNIRGNHVAILPRGRAGPEVRIRLDADDAVSADATTSNQETNVKKIILDGVEYDVTNDTALQAAVNQLAKARDTEKARADAAVEQAKTEKARADAAVEQAKPEVIAKAAAERAKVLTVAEQVLSDAEKTKLDSMADLEIKTLVIKAVTPGAKLEGKSADFISGRYDAAVEALEEDEGDDDDGDGDGDGDDSDDSDDDDDQPSARRDHAVKKPVTSDQLAAARAREARNAWKR